MGPVEVDACSWLVAGGAGGPGQGKGALHVGMVPGRLISPVTVEQVSEITTPESVTYEKI